MKPTWIVAALCAITCSTLTAQSTSSTKERIRQEVAEKQRLMREGKVVRSNVRVTVRLENGSRLRGVVKNSKFIERHDGLAFVPSERATEGSGLRIWYYDQTNSYIFLPWNTIIDHTIGEVLTDEEVAKMGLELDRIAKENRERAGIEQEKRTAKLGDPGKGEGPPPPDPTKGGGGPAQQKEPESALTAEQKALLAEFPPEEGWGLDKMKQLEARKIQVGVFPNEKEKRFLDNFAAWNEAYELRRAEESRKASGGPQGTPGVVTTGPAKSTTPQGQKDPASKPPGR